MICDMVKCDDEQTSKQIMLSGNIFDDIVIIDL